MHELGKSDTMARLAVCAAVAVAVIYGAEKLCEGKNWPLWERCAPWIRENRIQAVAILAAVLYGASLALWPEEKPLTGEGDGEYEACP